ncbi:hypothetical protein KII95_05215 [Leuconostoc gelidum subsp. aenigmaticum]|uniref:hypothetical protein n=1 Tax=Leuconostoc gelidum TaxID=1244 RepID=UPI00021939A2|nr:hypothetical protein [Leuconostoc gelidum]AFS41209.1 hypothetical protein C269_08875 [Leuconostoc gelidum JB7]MBZ5992662.1 hypothetical protein [Leuconostoc gelidum subsp. gelidum]MBZ6003419.1 hypothetical protein [Leuconostoc gelidum subsp. aenigmaticum]MBZ6009093.1 hypothetical protein [Leuconostoc gelidum subsp. aenigmaticum]USP17412.1 hypothetical protein J4766_01025 [Leuconostoc gelidum subsp. aenigmaticum]
MSKLFQNNKEELATYLKSVHVQSNIEQNLIDNAISQLSNKVAVPTVLQQLSHGFWELTIQGHLSKEGLDLYTKLQRPDFASDFGRSFNLWIQ